MVIVLLLEDDIRGVRLGRRAEGAVARVLARRLHVVELDDGIVDTSLVMQLLTQRTAYPGTHMAYGI